MKLHHSHSAADRSVTTVWQLEQVVEPFRMMMGKKRSSSHPLFLQRKVGKIFTFFFFWGGGEWAVNYPRIFAFRGGPWNLNLAFCEG